MMSHESIVRENLKSLLGALGKFPGARYALAETGIVLYDGGVPDAYENYALLEPGYAAGAIESGLEFFRGHSNIWPIFPDVSDEAALALEHSGLARDDDFQAMTAELCCEPAAEIGKIAEMVRGKDEARAWADNAWRGFDSGEGAPEAFISFALDMAMLECFSLMRVGNESVGMLFASGGTCGIYYVATLPEARGRGLGGAIVDALKSRARELGFERVSLLATPSGHGLYLKHGFKDRGAVKIYRSDACE
jgi:ribosomal protein S18 acetylase RimI-like enzyme